ncbi:MAG: hypothetical protein ACRD1B_08170 [Thermoanaerobaculia bacterium]
MIMGTALLVLVGFTSAAIYMFGMKGLGLSRLKIGPALVKMVECLGAASIFLVLNLTIGVIAILAFGQATGSHVSLYRANDVAWLILSLLQGLTFQWWRELSKKPH